jgi:hypothetical protein
MANATKKIVTLAVAGGLAWGLWKVGGMLWSDDDASGTKHVVNQVWIERIPADQRDMIRFVAFVKHPRGRIGVAGKGSQWRQFLEGFQWALEGDRMTVVFPQDRVRANLRVRSWECEGEAPDPFTLCLEVSQGDRKARFYSREDWVIEPHDADSLEAIAADLPGIAEALPNDGVVEVVELDPEDTTLVERLPGD